MTTVKRTTAKKTTAKKSVKNTTKKATPKNPCWPGFEPTSGKKPGTKGSCKPVPGTHSKATKKATQKAAAASKLAKAGKPNQH